MRFLARFSNFCEPFKNNSESCPSNQVSAAAMTSTTKGKWRLFNCFFSPGNRWWSEGARFLRIGWMIKTLEAQVGQFLLGCKCPVSRGIVVREQDPLGELPAAFFLQNVLQLQQQRWVILRVDSSALWKIINEADVVYISKKNRGENFTSGFLHSEFFGTRWAAMPPLHWLLLCLRVIVI